MRPYLLVLAASAGRAEPPPICHNDVDRGRKTPKDMWVPFLAPSRHVHLRRRADVPAADVLLGTDNAWLPVTHTAPRPAQHYRVEHGVWFYYARGCSELFYNVGKTLAAQNRIDAALQLAERSPGGMARLTYWLISRRGPMDRGWVRSRPHPHSPALLAKARYFHALGGKALWDTRHGGMYSKAFARKLRTTAWAPLVEVLRLGASCWPRALTAEEVNHTHHFDDRNSCLGACARLELGVALLLDEFLDPFIAREASAAGYDSVQLLRQPQGKYGEVFRPDAYKWTVEILGLQSLNYSTEELTAHPTDELLRRLRAGGAEGRACVPANCTFACCMSCREGTPLLTRACEVHKRYRQEGAKHYPLGKGCRATCARSSQPSVHSAAK